MPMRQMQPEEAPKPRESENAFRQKWHVVGEVENEVKSWLLMNLKRKPASGFLSAPLTACRCRRVFELLDQGALS